jgi:hypothetical protein
LQRLAADGANYVTALTAFSADGYASVNLPGGTYQLLDRDRDGCLCRYRQHRNDAVKVDFRLT